jgi:3-oxoadipate enol-lactonase / 4-carboxymuconolactone decarboxylase
MPLLHIDGLRHYYRIDGQDAHPDGRPVLFLSHSLGCDHSQWDAQAQALQSHLRLVRYDIRGHGASDVPSGEYTIELLARDALAIADALGIARFTFCGLSLGGMIGQWIATHAPQRLTHLVLANTSARFPDPSVMEARRQTVLRGGMSAVADAVMGRFFSQATLAESLAGKSPAVSRTRRVLLSTDPVGYAGCCAAIRDMDQTASLRDIRTPALIIVGDGDVSTPWTGHGEVLAREVPEAAVVRLPTAHLSNLERPYAFTAALAQFVLPPAEDTLAAGFLKRRQVLGDAHVDRAIAATTDFTRTFQEMITRYAWGTVWQRPGLDDRTRRLLALTATAALGRWEEFRQHVRAGLAHDLEACDIEEMLLQVAVYAGVPAANTGFKITAEEIAQAGAPTETKP